MRVRALMKDICHHKIKRKRRKYQYHYQYCLPKIIVTHSLPSFSSSKSSILSPAQSNISVRMSSSSP